MSEWKTVLLEDVTEYVTNKISISELRKEDYISTTNMLTDKQGVLEIAELPKTNTVCTYKKNDTLISNIRPYFKKIWYADRNGTNSSDVLVFRTLDANNTDSKYLYYCLYDDKFFAHMMAGAKGTKMPRGDKSAIMKYRINLPPLPTQRRIAAILSSIDDKIENNRKTAEKLEEIAQAIFKRWFVDFEFPNKDGKPYKSSGGEMVCCDELGMEIPQGWECGIVSDIAKNEVVKTGKTPSSKIKNRFGDYMQFVTIPDLHQGSYINKTERCISEEATESQIRSIIPRNSVMVSCIATPGLVGIASEDCLTNQQINSFECDEKYGFIFGYFLMKYLSKTIIDFASSGSATPNLNKTQFSKLNIIIPDSNALIRFQQQTISCFELILNLKKEIEELQQTRDALLLKLMSGEIGV